MAEFYHPIDTEEIFNSNMEILNLSYRLHYNQPVQVRKGKEEFDVHNKVSVPERLLKKISEVEQHWTNQLLHMDKSFEIAFLEGVPEDRIAAGLGQDVTEGTMDLHHVYGVPYIPGSTIKGAVRGWFIEAFCEGQEERLKEDPIGSWAFGTQERQGRVQFQDVLLHDGLAFEKMTQSVHFQRYYSGKAPAGDDQSVIPFNYLSCTVRKARFTVSVPKQLPEECPVNSGQLLKMAVAWMQHALSELGIGSKKSYNFGRFKNFTNVTAAIREEWEQQEAELKKAEAERKRQAAELQAAKEREQMLENMSPVERLRYKLKNLIDSDEDLQKSKSELYNEVFELKDPEAAELLRDYWKKHNSWILKKSKKRQAEKSSKIQEIIDSE